MTETDGRREAALGEMRLRSVSEPRQRASETPKVPLPRPQMTLIFGFAEWSPRLVAPAPAQASHAPPVRKDG